MQRVRLQPFSGVLLDEWRRCAVIDDGVPVDVGHGIEIRCDPFSPGRHDEQQQAILALDGIDRAVALEVDDSVPDAVKLKVANDPVHAVLLLRRTRIKSVRVNVPVYGLASTPSASHHSGTNTVVVSRGIAIKVLCTMVPAFLSLRLVETQQSRIIRAGEGWQGNRFCFSRASVSAASRSRTCRRRRADRQRPSCVPRCAPMWRDRSRGRSYHLRRACGRES